MKTSTNAAATTATATATAKKVNYTAEQTTALLAAYDNGKGQTKEQLAATFGKTPRSIVAKLSREKVWVPAKYVTKQGGEVTSKEALVSEIASIIEVDSTVLEGLEKANKSTLQLLVAALSQVAACLEVESEFDSVADVEAANKFDEVQISATV